MISDTAITDFKNLYQKHFNTQLNTESATELALLLLSLFKLIYKPIPKKHSQVLHEHSPMYEL